MPKNESNRPRFPSLEMGEREKDARWECPPEGGDGSVTGHSRNKVLAQSTPLRLCRAVGEGGGEGGLVNVVQSIKSLRIV